MKKAKVLKVIAGILLLGAGHAAMAAFTGTTAKKSSHLYSLKSFNKNFYKNTSLFSFRSFLNYKDMRIFNQRKDVNGDIVVTSIMRYEKGNTTYVYPYVHKIVVPKFKTPSPPSVVR